MDQANNVPQALLSIQNNKLIVNYLSASNLFTLNVFEKLDSLGQTEWKYYSSITYTSDVKRKGSDIFALGSSFQDCDVLRSTLRVEKLDGNGNLLDSASINVKTFNLDHTKLGLLPSGFTTVFTDSNTYILVQQLDVVDTVSYSIAGGVTYSTYMGNDSILLNTPNGELIFDLTNYTFHPVQLTGDDFVKANDSTLLSFNRSTSTLYKYSLDNFSTIDSINSFSGFNPQHYHAKGDFIILYDSAQYVVLTSDLNLTHQGVFKYPNTCNNKPASIRINESGQLIRVLANCIRNLQIEIESFHFTAIPPDRFDNISIENLNVGGTLPDTIVHTGDPNDPHRAGYDVVIELECRNNSNDVLTNVELAYKTDFWGICSSGDIRLSLSNLNVSPGNTFNITVPTIVKSIVSVAQPKSFPFGISFCSANNNIIIPEDTGMTVNLSWIGLEEDKHTSNLIYPNPFKSELVIKGDFERGTVFRLISQAGVVAIEEYNEFKTDQLILNTRELLPGLYLMSIEQQGEYTIHRKVLKL